MRLTFWQFLGLLAAAGLFWFLLYVWGEQQNTWAWVDTLQGWFIKSERELEREKQAPPPDSGGWIQ